MLEVKDLVMRFYTYDGVVNALNGVSFRVDKGEIFGLVGETGCGKSVTCYSILHLLIPISGRFVLINQRSFVAIVLVKFVLFQIDP